MNDFRKDLQIGKKGEFAVASYLATRNHQIEDVSDNQEYRDMDIDMIIRNPQGQKCTVEVKSDKKIGDTGNFCIEECNDRETGVYKGWFYKCKADYICFYDYTTGRGYIVDWNKAKPQIKQKAQYTAFENRGDGGLSWVYLLPISVAKREGWITHSFTFLLDKELEE